MKSSIKNDAENNAKKLRQLSNISPDKRQLFERIVKSAPQNLTNESHLNNYFATEYKEDEYSARSKQSIYRIYATLAVAVVFLLGGGIFLLGWQNRSINISSQSSQIVANGKVSNAVNAISEQTQSELKTVQSANIDTTNLDTINTQLGQMQEVINEKF